jgi:hypothetical protein
MQRGVPESRCIALVAKRGHPALLLDITRTRVGRLARIGRLPGTVRGGRRWFPRSHVEQVAAARAFAQRTAG